MAESRTVRLYFMLERLCAVQNAHLAYQTDCRSARWPDLISHGVKGNSGL